MGTCKVFFSLYYIFYTIFTMAAKFLGAIVEFLFIFQNMPFLVASWKGNEHNAELQRTDPGTNDVGEERLLPIINNSGNYIFKTILSELGLVFIKSTFMWKTVSIAAWYCASFITDTLHFLEQEKCGYPEKDHRTSARPTVNFERIGSPKVWVAFERIEDTICHTKR